MIKVEGANHTQPAVVAVCVQIYIQHDDRYISNWSYEDGVVLITSLPEKLYNLTK